MSRNTHITRPLHLLSLLVISLLCASSAQATVCASSGNAAYEPVTFFVCKNRNLSIAAFKSQTDWIAHKPPVVVFGITYGPDCSRMVNSLFAYAANNPAIMSRSRNAVSLSGHVNGSQMGVIREYLEINNSCQQAQTYAYGGTGDIAEDADVNVLKPEQLAYKARLLSQ